MLPLLVFALLLDPQEKPPERCAVAGTVVDAITDKPVAKAEIELRPLSGSAQPIAVTRTDGAGRFRLVDVDPGAYRLAGTRAAYLETFYGARRAGGEGTILRLDPGQSIDDLHLKLFPSSVLTGRILDPDGEPVPGAHVVLAQRAGWFGRPRVHGIDSVDANDEGVYRFSGLAPGKYYVEAEPKSDGWNKVDHSPATDTPRTALVASFYPGVRDSTAAATVEVRPGEKREGLDITLIRSRVFRVRGRAATGAQRSTVMLRYLGDDGIHDFDLRTVTRNRAGDFEFPDVAPGSYRLELGESGVPVEVGFGDLDGVRLSVGLADLHVRLACEGGEPSKADGMTVFVTQDGRRGYFLNIGPEGVVSHSVSEGVYDVQIGRVPKGFYVKSVRSGEHDVIADRLQVPAGAVALDIVLAADGSRIEGSVPEASGAVVVALTPKNRERFDRFTATTTDQYGRYVFVDVPPGEYKLFAWDDVGENEWLDPDFLKRYESQGVAVTAAPRGSQSVDLKIARDK